MLSSRALLIACRKLAGMSTSPGRYTTCLTMYGGFCTSAPTDTRHRAHEYRICAKPLFSPRMPACIGSPSARASADYTQPARTHADDALPQGPEAHINHGRSSWTCSMAISSASALPPPWELQTPWPASPARVDASREDREMRPMSLRPQWRTSEYFLYWQRVWGKAAA